MLYESQLLKVQNALQAFSDVTDIPVCLLNEDNQEVWSHKKELRFCNLFGTREACKPECEKLLTSAARTAAQLDEAYLFSCGREFLMIAYPFRVGLQNCGCFFAGPIFTRTSKKENVDTLLQKNSDTIPRGIYSFVRSCKFYTAAQVQELYILFHYTLSGALSTGNVAGLPYTSRNEMKSASALTQAELDEAYPYESEQRIFRAAKKGDFGEAEAAFRALFSELESSEHRNLTFIKLHLLEFLALLFRHVLGKEHSSQTFQKHMEFVESLNAANTLYDLYQIAISEIKNCCEEQQSNIYNGSSEIMMQALKKINSSYSEEITLKSIANDIHINPSYLSTLFKKETGQTFSQYLLMLRLEESKQLLLETNLDITEIAYKTGFNSQSYFIKVFRDHTGQTPKEYRKQTQ